MFITNLKNNDLCAEIMKYFFYVNLNDERRCEKLLFCKDIEIIRLKSLCEVNILNVVSKNESFPDNK